MDPEIGGFKMPGTGGFQGNYVPEMQGMTDMQQRSYMNEMNKQQAKMNQSYSQTNLQNGGAFLGQQRKVATAGAQGMQDIASKNAYQNAIFAIKDRQRREDKQFQTDAATTRFDRQNQMMDRQQQAQVIGMVGSGLGGIAGSAVSAFWPKPANPVNDAIMAMFRKSQGLPAASIDDVDLNALPSPPEDK